MKKALAALLLVATASGIAGCSSTSVYGGMIGAGIGGLNGDAASGMLIGAGIGGLIDAMDDK
jgi:phosphate/sulfate permease